MAVIRSVFISAVNAEFPGLREQLKTAIDRAEWKVWTQENLTELGEPTLEKLDQCIQRCDCMIHIAGRQSGSPPRYGALEHLRAKHPRLGQDFPELGKFLLSADDTLSLTQWEAWLAEFHGVPLLVLGPQPVVDELVEARKGGHPPTSGGLQFEHLSLLWQRNKRCQGYPTELQLASQVHTALDRVAPRVSAREPYAWAPALGVAVDTTGGRFVGREWLFDRITDWEAADDGRPLLLLGGFGMGKTAAMLELARLWQGRHVVQHFCQFNHDETLRPGRIVLNIASQLAQLFPAYRQAVEEDKHLQELLAQADENPSLALKGAVLAPLHQLGEERCGRCLLIIDALDESLEFKAAPGQSVSRTATLVDLVVDASIVVPKWFRILISSRPIDAVKGDAVRRHFTIVELERDGKPYSDEDVATYVTLRASGDERIRVFLRAAGHTESELARKLSGSSEGRFLLLRYVLDDIASGHITAAQFDSLPVRVGAFYETAFRHRVSRSQLQLPQVMALLGLVAVVRMPLAPRALAAVLPATSTAEVMAIFEAFSGLLVRNEQGGINFAHFSLEEWLDGKGEQGFVTPAEYLIDREQAETRLLAYCVQMSQLALEETGEFRPYLEGYGVRLLVEKQAFAPALELLISMRAHLTELQGGAAADAGGARATLDQRCAKQTVLVADRIRAHWRLVDEKLGSARQRMRQPLAAVDPEHLKELLYRKDYETGKYVPIIRVLIECHREAWQGIMASILGMEEENDLVFRHDSGVAYAQAWHAASSAEQGTLLAEISQMARNMADADRREMAGYALKHICERTDRRTWWGSALPTIKLLASEYACRELAMDRMVAGEMMLALAIQGERVTQWFADQPGQAPFWDAYWPNLRADVSAIRTVLGEPTSTTAADEVDSGPESQAQARALHDQALALGERLGHAAFFREHPVGQKLAVLLGGNLAQQGHAEVLDHTAVRALAAALRGPDRDDVVAFMKYLMLHPLWNAIERASTLVAAIVKRDPELDFLIDELSTVAPEAWRIRYGAVDAAYNCGSQDKYQRFFALLAACGADPSCRVRGIAIDDLNGWIKDAEPAEVERRLRDPGIVALIRTWLKEADDVWLLEYLHEMFVVLRDQKHWSEERMAELVGPAATKLTRYLADARFYRQPVEDFLEHIERVRRVEWEAGRASAG